MFIDKLKKENEALKELIVFFYLFRQKLIVKSKMIQNTVKMHKP